jgi:hypothetical protein
MTRWVFNARPGWTGEIGANIIMGWTFSVYVVLPVFMIFVRFPVAPLALKEYMESRQINIRNSCLMFLRHNKSK